MGRISCGTAVLVTWCPTQEEKKLHSVMVEDSLLSGFAIQQRAEAKRGSSNPIPGIVVRDSHQLPPPLSMKPMLR
ncbi:unnamed protein product [Nezara viridula]|uniref:Uncharacterized protein n=1 Tax=Nezara viridula TaxID=85310 RepID=A0A9P0HDU3_NEZVI|nr:unnamed protein product [Nezara viridula]